MKPFLFAFLLPILLTPIACRKQHLNSNGLPPATQTGANSFGLILNGQAWTPQGNNGTPNLSMYYDPTYSGGVFNIAAFRNTSVSNGHRQILHLFGDSIQVPARILLPNNSKLGFTFWDEQSGCNYSSSDSSTVFLNGFFDLQKLDKINHIFSGQFELSFKKTGFPDVQISEGRFDLKF